MSGSRPKADTHRNQRRQIALAVVLTLAAAFLANVFLGFDTYKLTPSFGCTSESNAKDTTHQTRSSHTIPENAGSFIHPAYFAGANNKPVSRSTYKDVDNKMNTIWSYSHKLDGLAIQRGLLSYGDPLRMRAFIHKLLQSDKDAGITIAGIGTSILLGSGGSSGHCKGTKPTWAWLEDWLLPTFSNIKMTNRAVGGTGAAFHASCFSSLLPEDVDLLIIEDTVAIDIAITPVDQVDPSTAIHLGSFAKDSRLSYEQLIRKALQLPNKPAVLILHHYTYPRVGGKFEKSSENDYNVIASYYSLPVLSMRAAVWQYMKQDIGGYRAETDVLQMFNLQSDATVDMKEKEVAFLEKQGEPYYCDEVHPYGNTGHRYMADMIAANIQMTASSILNQPFTTLEAERLQKADANLPPPMIKNNYEMPSSCLLFDKMQKAAIEHDDKFEWIRERPDAEFAYQQKYGWISTTPGSWVVFQIDTRSTRVAGASQRSGLMVSYLRSYEHMGKAKIECIANCECESVVINGHWEQRISVANTQNLEVTANEDCQLKVTVLDETDSGEYKVKIDGLIVLPSGSRNTIAGGNVGELLKKKEATSSGGK